jgi:hypothetical protein
MVAAMDYIRSIRNQGRPAPEVFTALKVSTITIRIE